MNQVEPQWVTGKDGFRGQILPSTQAQNIQASEPQTLIQMDNGQQVFVPSRLIVRQTDGSFFLPLSAQELTQQSTEAIVLPVIQEQLNVEKRQVQTGGVRVRKTVHQREEVVDETLLHDEVQVERIPINQLATSVPAVRYEGDTTIIPILEEVLVVEKRLMVKEEVRITKRQVRTESQPQRVTLRSEEAIVEKMEAAQANSPSRPTETGLPLESNLNDQERGH